MKNDVEVKLDKEDSKYSFKYIGSVLSTLIDEPFMQKKPNTNSYFLDALAVQTMALTNLMISLKSTLKRNEIETSAVLVRTIVEIVANVNYIITHKDKDKIAEAYLRTEKSVPDMFFKIRKGQKIKPIYWAEIGPMKRLRLYSDKYEGINIEALYYYLSSYAHADAGFIGAYTYGHKKNLKPMFTAFLVLMVMEYMDLLAEADVINKDAYGKSVRLFAEKVEAMKEKTRISEKE